MTITHRAGLLAGLACLLPYPAFAQPDEAEAANAELSAEEESEVIIVQATRSGRRVQDEPVRVEVLNREEIEEKILMRPGNIAVILSETGGLRVQVTSPALGSANIRVHGMDGRYTQLLADGLPLYGGQASSLGLLQVAPTDLGQVEVIKGAASALYGASALGGVINLVSRRPRGSVEGELLFNATSQNGQDATAYGALPFTDDLSASLTVGYHRQTAQDLDDDGWIDMASFRRLSLRPRFYWDNADGASVFMTLGAMTESREGGTLAGRTTPDGQPFPQTQDTDRFDSGLVAEMPLTDTINAHFRGSAMLQDHLHRFGAVIEDDRHGTLFAEASVSGGGGATNWVGGFAVQEDTFRSASLPQFDYTYRVPGLFAQLEQEFGDLVTVAGSGRVDWHNRLGTRFSPRLSLLARPGPWTIRASAGRGFYAPTPFVEEIEAAGLSQLEVPQGLEAETATTASLDIGYARRGFEATATLFGAWIDNATELETVSANRVRLVNSPGEARISGAEMLMRYRHGDFVVTGSYVYLDATEPHPAASGLRRETPLTPAHTGGLVAMWEQEDRGRIGLEFYYTGPQSLDDNPYRTTSPAYVDIGLLGEIAIGRARVFLNAENILGSRQTERDPILRRTRAPDGRWTVDVWGPTEGFVLNGGVRLRFGGEE